MRKTLNKTMDFLTKTSTIILIVSLITASVFFFLYHSNEKVTSRVWMEYAENIVREEKPTPPASARFYAYISSVYYDTLVKTKSEDQASIATAEIINYLYKNKTASSTAILKNTKMDKIVLSKDADKIVKRYQARHTQDLKQSKMPIRPTGDQYWVGENPFEPSAGSWQRWVIGTTNTFKFAPPPLYKSKEHVAALVEVKEAAAMRTSEQGAKINFWGGVPGTEAPAGIWQERLYAVTKDLNLTDVEYAYAQKILAQSVADSFMECWKVKYTYWTKRPSMVDGDINLAMKNPPFPSYLSGHSTVSRTAAEVLSVMFPEYKDVWLSDAEEAKNSRLWAGIHYGYDNEIGADVGRQIGEVIAQKINLGKIK